MKNLVVISYAFPPQLNPEAILVGKLLAGLSKQRRFRITVICADEKGSTEPIDVSLPGILPKGLDIVRLPTGERSVVCEVLFKTIPVLRNLPDKSLWWVLRNSRRIIPLCRKARPDVLYSHSHYLGSHLLALQVKNATGLPWAAHFSDPWTRNPYTRFALWTHAINKHWERRVLEQADKLIFVSRELRDFMLEGYPRKWKKKSIVVPHPYDPSLYQRTRRQHHPNSPVIVSYVGNFYGKRVPIPFLHALSLLKRIQPTLYAQLEIRFIGYLSEKQKRHAVFREHASSIVHIPPVPYLKSLDYMQTSDILLLIDANVQPAVFLPSKLIDYLGTGKPVLGITPANSPATKLLRNLGQPCATPDDPKAIACALAEVVTAVRGHDHFRFRYKPDEIHAYALDTVAAQVGDCVYGLR